MLALLAGVATYLFLGSTFRLDSATESTSAADTSTPLHFDKSATGKFAGDSTDADPLLAAAIASSGDEHSRSPTSQHHARGRVVDQTGLPIQGARIDWTPLDPFIGVPERAWEIIDWDVVDSLTLTATSSANGEFSFQGVPQDDTKFGSVLWATCEGFAAQYRMLDPGASADPETWQLSLTADEGFHVRVVDPNRTPAPAARLRQFARPPRDRALSKRERVAFELFHLELPLDHDARAEAVCLPWYAAFDASLGEQRGKPTFASSQSARDVEVQLLNTFVLTGRVRVMDGTPRIGDMQLWVAGVTSSASFQTVTGTRVRDDLTFGPIAVPLEREESFLASIEGGGLARERVRFERPAPGEHVELTLESSRGARQVIEVLGPDGHGVEDAWVSCLWWNADKSGSGSAGRTDSQGQLTLEGIVPGTVYLSVEAVGFVPRSLDPMEFPLPGDGRLTIDVQRGFELRGRCTHRGEPVQDFEVIWWPDVPREREVESFVGRATGDFELHNVPLGPVYLMAVAESLPQSTVVCVNPSVTPNPFVELELPVPLLGRGMLVDAEDGSPLPGGKIELWASFGKRSVARRGLKRPVDPTGRFELKNFPPGESLIVASADGYADREVLAHSNDEGTVEFGAIGLTRNGTWTIRLVGATAEVAQATSLNLHGPHGVPLVHFDSSGTAVVPGVAPGSWFGVLEFPDGEILGFRRVLPPATNWRLDLPLDSHRELEVLVRPASGNELPGFLSVTVSANTLAGDWLQYQVSPDAEGIARFRGLWVDEVALDVWEGQYAVHSTRVRLHSEQNRLEIELGAERIRGRVVDKEGAPLRGATLLAFDGVGSGWEVEGNCDEQGTVEFALPDFEPLFVRAWHPDFGEGRARSLTSAERRSGSFEIELDPGARLELLATELGQPRTGTRFDLFDEAKRRFVATIDADTAGVARRAQLETANYVVAVASPGVWYQEFVVAVTDPPSVQPIEVRSLGALEVIVLDEQDAPLAGVDVELHCLDLDTDVAAWIAAERVAAPAGGLRTDANGALRLAGLPRAEYRVRAGVLESTGQVPRVATGTITLRPH